MGSEDGRGTAEVTICETVCGSVHVAVFLTFGVFVDF